MPNNPAFILQGFTGPATTNTKGKAFFESRRRHGRRHRCDRRTAPRARRPGRCSSLRQTLLNPEERRRSTVDAMAYGLGLGVTSHLDQGAFQKTNTPADGAAHEDNYTMQLPFIEVHHEGKLKARVQINFLHMETDPNLPGLKERLRTPSSSSATTC